jgi:sugar O-acyltransferase (sialic acid O-acetyltransferase NeuD family)
VKQTSVERPRRLLIIGAGGLGTEFAWVASEMNGASRGNTGGCALWEILGYADDDPGKKGQIFRGCIVHGTIQDAFAKFGCEDIGFAVAIGSNKTRECVAALAEELGWTAETLVHPSAIVASTAEIGGGSYLAPGTVVCPGASVGRHVIINTHVSVGHDSLLDDFAQICPGARVSGGCRVERGGFLGSNASLAPRVVVGEGAVVGACSLVLRKVRPRTTVLGCPAIAIGKASR